MTLGLPGHLVQSVLSGALARASHWFGLVCLLVAAASVAILAPTVGSPVLWGTVAALLAMAAALALLAKRRTVAFSVFYLVLGTACIALYSVTLLALPDIFPTSNLFLIALPKMALVMVGGAGSGALVGVLWSTAGFVLAETATIFAVLQSDVPYRPDEFTICAYLLLVGILFITGLVHNPGTNARLSIHRAVQEDAARVQHHDLTSRAIALLNDTAVSELDTLSRSTSGELPAPVRARIRETLDTLTENNWLTDARSPRPAPGADQWLSSALHTAVDRCRDRDLVVTVTGERAALGRLDAETDRELGLAVEQCLVNVILHAGIVSAEVHVDAKPDSVLVMVTDAGSGFTESESAGDRLGLRQSVRQRIERLGGSVTIWTRPGAGTSVLLSVPAAVPAAVPAGTSAGTSAGTGPGAHGPAAGPDPLTSEPVSQ